MSAHRVAARNLFVAALVGLGVPAKGQDREGRQHPPTHADGGSGKTEGRSFFDELASPEGPGTAELRSDISGLDGGPSGPLAEEVPPIESFENPVSPSPSSAAVERPPPPQESFPTVSASVSARPFGYLRAQLGGDTRWDSPRGDSLAENVVDLKARAQLGADIKVSDSVRLQVEGRLRWRAVAEAGFDRTKADAELSLGEAFVDWYSPGLDLRVGQQVFAFGANAALAPADALNPRDLREGLLQGEIEDAKLPVPGVRALGELGKIEVTVVYVPFFIPSRFNLLGQDEALIQPGLGVAVPRRPDPSVEDEQLPALLQTERPKAFPWLGDLGLRARHRVGKTQLGLSWVWINEKLPQVNIDPELAAVLSASSSGKPVNAAQALSVQNRYLAGETLFRGHYDRQHILSAEATALVGGSQLDLDLSYSPRQTFVDSSLEPVSKASVTWVLGLSQASEGRLTYALSYLGLAIPDVAAERTLFLVEPGTARGAARTAWFHLFLGTLGYTFLEKDLEVSVRAAFEPIQGSFALAPRVSYRGIRAWTFWLGAEVYQGAAYSPFGYFGRNDQLLAGIQRDLF